MPSTPENSAGECHDQQQLPTAPRAATKKKVKKEVKKVKKKPRPAWVDDPAGAEDGGVGVQPASGDAPELYVIEEIVLL